MTINELRKRKKKRWDGKFKSYVVGTFLLGLVKRKEICTELKISRSLLRRWQRWDYKNRVLRFTKHSSFMKKTVDIQSLEARIKELELVIEQERLRSESYEILLRIGKEKYRIDLKKKTGLKQKICIKKTLKKEPTFEIIETQNTNNQQLIPKNY
jgi:transposase-like protein